ncbi:MAG: hypothetical protein FJ304_21830 [Planctomycetes bacterium]|nr:hypothetical protein [Planctomycetota bacterium]
MSRLVLVALVVWAAGCGAPVENTGAAPEPVKGAPPGMGAPGDTPVGPPPGGKGGGPPPPPPLKKP